MSKESRNPKQKGVPSIKTIQNYAQSCQRPPHRSLSNIERQLRKWIAALATDEIAEVPDRDGSLDNAIRDGIVTVGIAQPEITHFLRRQIVSNVSKRRQIANAVVAIGHEHSYLEEDLLQVARQHPGAEYMVILHALVRQESDAAAAVSKLLSLIDRLPQRCPAHVDHFNDEFLRLCMGSPACWEQLLQASKAASCSIRKEWFRELLGANAMNDPAALDWLLARKNIEDDELRQSVAVSLALIALHRHDLCWLGTSENNENVPMMQFVLMEADDGNRRDLVKYCLTALEDPEDGVRAAALIALVKIESAAEEAFDAVVDRLVDDRSEMIVVLAAIALCRINTQRATMELSRLQMSQQPPSEFRLQMLEVESMYCIESA